ncbi:MAG: tannase/feruloyl esterase family alpha/beta hydrolase [Burkholderiales bacterium]|nr:tannase/feruloyl esterase family alpha/beta hydrolase [Burkholderiales bacterium]
MIIYGSKLGQSPRLLAAGFVAVALAGCGGSGGGVAEPAGPTAEALKATCASLKGQTVEGVLITATNRIEAKTGVADAGMCQVLGTRAPFLDIEVTVPDNWSGRLYQQGGGGLDGRLASAVTLANGTLAAVHASVAQKGAIYAASNGGNRAAVPAQASPAVWIGGSADAQASATDYAYRALGTTVTFAKGIAKAFYAKVPTYTYFNGCSNGGRNAYTAAQRWPTEYNGIVSGCESMDMGGLITGMLNTAAKANTPADITPAQYADAYAKAVAVCDAPGTAVDGLADGYLANPGACTLTAAALQCGQPGASTDPALCLSAAQATTLSGLLGNLVLTSGATAYSKLNWTNFAPASAIQGVPALGVTSYGGLGGAFAFLATNDPRWFGAPPPSTAPAPNLTGYDFNVQYPIFTSGLQQAGADHDKAAIGAYVASGRKLLSWHDAGDPLISANDHMRNFSTMSNIARTLSPTDPRSNARMFIVPASTHGAGGNFTEIDWLTAIIDWVETNKAPDQLTYRFATGTTARSMPVCEAPKYPRYNGTGDINSASSFTCT